ncbi:MAG TPA: DUF2203 domain-containing protein [Chthonomonadaceae bacterium]|nr:DUF2203 domain-containing protein [Chthonomonadaceae bacterium]
MAVHEKHFTLEQARNELPGLRRRFARIRELLAELQQAQMELEQIQKLIRSNGQASSHPDYGETLRELQDLVTQITERGIEIKDLASGLVDFSHWREGHEVYLCWLYGEEDIRYWHTLDGGFAGRKPL